MRLVQIALPDDPPRGFTGTLPPLSRREHDQRMTARPLRDAVDGVLEGDDLKHHRDALEHDRLDTG